MNIYRPLVETRPVDFDKGSTLVLILVDRKLIASTCGPNSKHEANVRARAEEKRIYDEEDRRRKEKGLVKVSRPNV